MKTEKDVKAYKKVCEEIICQAEQNNVFAKNDGARGFLAALEWVLAPRGQQSLKLGKGDKAKIWRNIEKKIKKTI